jgi:hypothetical protein
MIDPNREKRVKTVALALADFSRFTMIYLHYCSRVSYSRIAEVFRISSNQLKKSISKAHEVYDVDYMCHEFPLELVLSLTPFFKEKNGRYKCLYCGRYVTKRGRTQHILSMHKDMIAKYVW